MNDRLATNAGCTGGKLTGRRAFLGASGAALLAARSLRAADSSIQILLEEPIGNVSPEIYGHFAEHLGGVVYDGIWVGEKSKIPNIRGVRRALVEHMRRLKPAVVRWPGGCFADSYDWRDGIGPRASRPRRTNFWIDTPFLMRAPDGPQKYDPNHFGTNEFVRFCRLIGAQPYLAANVRSLTARDLYDWVEYCNAPAGLTTLSDQRAAGGDREPFNVRFWGIGNESWGCGGGFTPEEYATEYRRFISWAPQFGQNLAFIAAGPNGGDMDWTHRFFRKLTDKGVGQLRSLWGWALHYYCGTAGQGNSIEFTLDDWYELLVKADRMESLIVQHWAAMGEVDKERRVKLVVDEWGAWHHEGTEVHPAHLFGQTSTIRDALVAALTLDAFNRHADKVAMANVAQLINCLHSLFLAREEKFILTPNFHVFEMYAAHQNGQSLRSIFSAPRIARRQAGKPDSLWGLSGSASLHGRELVLTVVNPHAAEARETEIVVRRAAIASCSARTLAPGDLHAHNSFANPRAVEPRDGETGVKGAPLVYRFEPASVTRLRMRLV